MLEGRTWYGLRGMQFKQFLRRKHGPAAFGTESLETGEASCIIWPFYDVS